MQSPKTLPPYEQIRTFQTHLRGKPVWYQSKPGLADWDQIKPSTTLIAELVTLPSTGRCIFYGCGHAAGVVAAVRQAPNSEIWLTDVNFISLQMARLTLEQNRIEKAVFLEDIAIPEPLLDQFQAVIIDMPKGRRLARRWLVQAWHALQPEGILYLAGSNSEGIHSVVQDAQDLWGPGTLLGYHKGSRIARFIKKIPGPTWPNWASQPGIALNTWVEIDLIPDDHALHLYSLPGIFSYDRLDGGTKFLLANISIPAGAHLLDLGCGYGIIGLVGYLSGAAAVDLVDVNLLAIAATRKNFGLYGYSDATILASDALHSVRDREYDLILSNPPFHAGKAVDYQMAQAFIEQSRNQLTPGGEFTLVANQFIRYDQLMAPLFKQVNLLAQNQGFKVWQGVK
jgi:16S rRNA (guanine1207-N2)-methyltransferase